MGKQALIAAAALAAAGTGLSAGPAGATDGVLTAREVVAECEAETRVCDDFLFKSHRYVHATLQAFDRNHPLTRCMPRRPAGADARADEWPVYRFLRERLVVWLKASGDMDAPAFGTFARLMRRRTSRILSLCRR